MNNTRKQKSLIRWASQCDEMFGRKNSASNRFREQVRRIDKRKRQQMKRNK